MKYILPRFIGLLAIAVIIFGFHGHAYAQSIAVVNVERVLNDADAAKALNKKRTSARESFLSTLSKQEELLRKEGKTLFDKRKELGDEEFAKQQRGYQEKLAIMSKETQQKRRAFEQASAVALETLKDELADVVRGIAKEKEYDLVISNRNVIAGANSLDVTDETIKAMNAKKIKIPFNVK